MRGAMGGAQGGNKAWSDKGHARRRYVVQGVQGEARAATGLSRRRWASVGVATTLIAFLRLPLEPLEKGWNGSHGIREEMGEKVESSG